MFATLQASPNIDSCSYVHGGSSANRPSRITRLGTGHMARSPTLGSSGLGGQQRTRYLHYRLESNASTAASRKRVEAACASELLQMFVLLLPQRG